MRAVNRFNVTHFWNPHVLRIPNWYGTCLGQKIFTIGLPAECGGEWSVDARSPTPGTDITWCTLGVMTQALTVSTQASPELVPASTRCPVISGHAERVVTSQVTCL